MKERLDNLTALLAEEKKMSKLNFVLSLLVALLSGVILGFLICPKRSKTSYMGCYNGNSNSNNNNNDCCDCDDCEGGLCCEDCDEERCCGEYEFCGNDTQCCDDDFEMDDEDGKEAADKEQDEDIKEYVKIM